MRGSITTVAFVAAVALAGAAQAQSFSYDDYADALKTYVNDQGMVNYAQLKAHNEKLDSFLDSLAGLNRQAYDGWTEPAKIAFWLNAYNACTLKAIIDHYPIQSSFFASLHYPKNSIRQIGGVWDKLKFSGDGPAMTLDGDRARSAAQGVPRAAHPHGAGLRRHGLPASAKRAVHGRASRRSVGRPGQAVSFQPGEVPH